MRITPIESVGSFEGIEAAWQLWRAVRHNDDLLRELPLVRRNYGNLLRAQGRIPYIRKLVAGEAYVAYLVKEEDGSTVGLATGQTHDPSPNPLSGGRNIELSYWTKRYRTEEQAIAVGTEVMRDTVQAVAQGLRLGADDMVWSVTLPDDMVKNEVLENSKFHPVAAAQPYELGDEVSEARQLWAAMPPTLWQGTGKGA